MAIELCCLCLPSIEKKTCLEFTIIFELRPCFFWTAPRQWLKLQNSGNTLGHGHFCPVRGSATGKPLLQYSPLCWSDLTYVHYLLRPWLLDSGSFLPVLSQESGQHHGLSLCMPNSSFSPFFTDITPWYRSCTLNSSLASPCQRTRTDSIMLWQKTNHVLCAWWVEHMYGSIEDKERKWWWVGMK
jgi:hypothetical protein